MKQQICTILGVIVALAALGVVFEAAGLRVRAQSPTTAEVAIDVAALKSDVSTLKDAVKESSKSMRELASVVDKQVGINQALTFVVGGLITLISAVFASRPWRRTTVTHICAECGKLREP